MSNEQDYPALPKGTQFIAGNNRYFAKVCGTVTAYTEDDLRAYADACCAAQAARHVKELAAYELTVSNLREQVAARGVPGLSQKSLSMALESTQIIRDFGQSMTENGYVNSGPQLIDQALKIERAMLAGAPQPAARGVPDAKNVFSYPYAPGRDYAHGWNDCRDAMLAATPTPRACLMARDSAQTRSGVDHEPN